jgi:hypothetical protein
MYEIKALVSPWKLKVLEHDRSDFESENREWQVAFSLTIYHEGFYANSLAILGSPSFRALGVQRL